jgi:hypothetical protein
MRLIAGAALLGLIATANAAGPALAEGCLKGAAVGGVAGHMAGQHAVLGSAAGCAVGHHEAANRDQAQQAARSNEARTDSTEAHH